MKNFCKICLVLTGLVLGFACPAGPETSEAEPGSEGRPLNEPASSTGSLSDLRTAGGHTHEKVDHTGDILADEIKNTREEIAELQRSVNAELALIREEKLELTKQVESFRDEISGLRTELSDAEHEDAEIAGRVGAVEQEIESARLTAETVRSLLDDWQKSTSISLTAFESMRFESSLNDLATALANDSRQDISGLLESALDTADDFYRSSSGGGSCFGSALDLDGVEVSGEFVAIGPVNYFSGDLPGLAGLVVPRGDTGFPTVFSRLDEEDLAGIRRFVRGGKGSVPIDTTGGSAIELRQTRDTFLQHLQKGGVTMIPLGALACVCVLLAIYKLISLSMLVTARAEDRVLEIIAAMRSDDVEKALDLAGSLREPLAPVIREGIECREVPKEHLEEILYERILSLVPGLERFLTPLAVCASTAPLLGLLGTVTGMIHTFRLITVFGTGDAKLLSSGISEALITTEVGLAIAIPALLCHAYLSRRVKRAVALTQQSALMFVNGLKLRGSSSDE